MDRRATFLWRTPPPTSVDEELAVYDDGTALLAVRGSHTLSPAVGTYLARPVESDLQLLFTAGPDPVTFDLLRPPVDPGSAALMAAADRVAAASLATPRAVATFHTQVREVGADGTLPVWLQVVGSGVQPVEFELDPGLSSVQFRNVGQTIAWVDLPDLPTGFVTPHVEGLGGVRRRAVVKPGAYGSIAFEVALPAGTTAIAVRVAGWLSEALPDDPMPAPFSLEIAEAPIEA